MARFGTALFGLGWLALACASNVDDANEFAAAPLGDAELATPLDESATAELGSPLGGESIPRPIIRRFSVAPTTVDRNSPTALTFKVALEPWNGAPVTCSVDHGVGVLNGPTTVTLTLPTTTDFTVTCSAPYAGSSSATRQVLALPPVTGPEPSPKILAFYYPWYGNPATNGQWFHWNDDGVYPPVDITSQYYPLLGPYSSNDPETLAQHFTWLRQAGVGVIATSWWGQDSFEDRAAQGLLDMAARYRVKVAFHIEPYAERDAETLVEDITYLNERYGSHPAFFRHTGVSRHNPSYAPKGVYFVWSPVVDHNGGTVVDAGYWRDALDALHAAGDTSLVIANQTDASWVDGGHFDGLYNFGTLEADITGHFDWSTALPPGAWYVPSVTPGAVFWNDTAPWPTLPRRDGATYAEQWDEALGTGVQPMMVTINSFNEWHEGTQLEPPQSGVMNNKGVPYQDFAPLGATAYLNRTSEEVAAFEAIAWPQIFPGRIRVHTTSDWTVLRLDSGAGWLRPETLQVSPEATVAQMENGRITLVQPIERAELGLPVELTIDLCYSGISYANSAPVVFAVERGWLGATTVTLWNSTWGSPSQVANFTWDDIAPDPPNTGYFPIPVSLLLP